MSKQLAEAALTKIVNKVLETSSVFSNLRTNYRKELNSRYHVLDLSYDALYSANVRSKSKTAIDRFKKDYAEFIKALKSIVPFTFQELDSVQRVPKETFFIESPALLISPSFETSRSWISKVSGSIPKNKYFGKSNRARKLSELISEGYSLQELEADNRIFDPKSGVELKLGKDGLLVPRYRSLSQVDLGHTPGPELGRDSPLSEQILRTLNSDNPYLSQEDFKNLEVFEDVPELNIESANQAIAGAILTKLGELSEIQAQCQVSFKNEVPKKLSNLLGGPVGFLSLTLQLYSVNNDISVKESAVRNKLIAEIKEEIRKVIHQIPGSNTMEQDLVVALRQEIITAISGKGSSAKLAKHSLAESITKSKPNKTTKPSVISSNLKVVKGTKIKQSAENAVADKSPSLTALQSLLNRHLQDVISANMGDGSRRDILNYRTGRFASTVKVERVSLSREGMITAFYSYMKNPYATFSQGGKQELPRTRDPKLLISKSIREIAAENAVTRMRSVSL